MRRWAFAATAIAIAAITACRDDKMVLTPESEQVTESEASTDVVGFYLLNEGNMGSNKSTLDQYDYANGTYTRNIFANANPTMVQELGDVGNDLQIYGNKLYAVINCSNFVEVMDAATATHIGTIQVPNCRYVQFSGAYGYLTSYAGPVKIDPEYEQTGYVAKFDTATLQIVATCLVGFQPDELAIADGRIYVANSGGYMVPNYENTVSVIDEKSFEEIGRVQVANNLHRVRADQHNQLWVTSRGDYYDQPSRLYCIDRQTLQVVDSVCVAVSDMDLVGDSLYVYGTEFSYETYDWTTSYGIVDVCTHKLVSSNFITDGTDKDIKMPYGVKVNPQNGDIFVTDAKNYVTPGTLYCFSPNGTKKWSVSTGDIPAHIAFIHNTKPSTTEK